MWKLCSLNVSFFMIFGGIILAVWTFFWFAELMFFLAFRHGTCTRNGESTGYIYIYMSVYTYIYIYYIYTCGNIVFFGGSLSRYTLQLGWFSSGTHLWFLDVYGRYIELPGLVNVQKTMANCHFWWVNPLFRLGHGFNSKL